MSAGEDLFAMQCRAAKLEPVREFRFSPPRLWRFDFAWPSHRIAVEIEGGVWINGRHNRGSGFVADCEKLNRAAELGFRVFRFPTEEVKSGRAIRMIEEVLGAT